MPSTWPEIGIHQKSIGEQPLSYSAEHTEGVWTSTKSPPVETSLGQLGSIQMSYLTWQDICALTIDDAVQYFTNFLSDAAYKCIPESSGIASK